MPFVDVVVSTYNEEAYLRRCLEAVLGQEYPVDRRHVWVVDGGSSDRTVEVAREFAGPHVTILAGLGRLNLPAALNVAIERCRGDLVAKIDAHGYPSRTYLKQAVAAFAEGPTGLACAGGRPEQTGETAFGKALAVARTSRIGVGSSGYAARATQAVVDTVQCGVYRRDALNAVGNFDPAMPYGEDEEVNWRLKEAGYDIVLDTRIRFHYITRPSWRAAYRQYRNYGEARVRVVRKHRAFLRARHGVPLVGLLGAGGLAGTAVRFRLARRMLVGLGALYFCIAGLAGVRAPRGVGVRVRLRVPGAVLALHLGYAVGTLRGLTSVARTRSSSSAARSQLD
jgi:succinoglycan biosynthesis protein ExoA